jgi:NAD(P)-dependent dehydrogenase (short-subunit alcohol dehydrogenase family)
MAAAACADITDKLAAAVSELRDRLGTADILINNAGISGPIGPAWEAPPAEWWQAIEVNLGGAFVLTQLALTHMVAEGRGRIINITSYADVYRWVRFPSTRVPLEHAGGPPRCGLPPSGLCSFPPRGGSRDRSSARWAGAEAAVSAQPQGRAARMGACRCTHLKSVRG